ncbi:alcohol dehydrogenase catalytic domain-containing protein [Pengzhenrongella sp.]|jgi:NADPH:quinone reductase-like Zn-dependent oxidoreductase|uniref:alcohol dehydrogenase catalytic domain-containing protein n=1 Tax=Pengzhenrongella sp. TaxID=2888820 RepID=UPI002F91DA85
MADMMRAIRLTGPGGLETLATSQVPVPEVEPGWVRIKVKAFGVNESEVTSRKGESGSDFTFPRILGIELAGIVDAVARGSRFHPGQQVVAMMGGMGRGIDGSYAAYCLVPEEHVIRFSSDLPWEIIGALPETFQTAYGSLTTGLGGWCRAGVPGRDLARRG